MKEYWVYILASKKNGTLYVGVTSDLSRRIYDHKQKLIDGFTKNYNITTLVYAEEFQDINDAIHREKCIKKWKREWKVKLIEERNPDWGDLHESIL
ncbi:MAG: GIY-YIG nuclease family protein [Rickettsiaceae bacterium]|nr:GIY-YIG nuclease family protein [Rickettsiaceae bacterium]